MKLFYFLSLCILVSLSAQAQDIKLSADEKVEWHQNEQKMIAVGNAVASKKDMSIKADRMTANYIKKNEKSQVENVYAEGNVQMHSPTTQAFGNTLNYKLSEDTVILQGSPAKIKTNSDTITAEDNIIYYPSQQKAIAKGNVVATSKDSKINSDTMIAYFEKNTKTDDLEMKQVEIFGNIKITSPDADVTAKKGIYLPKTGVVKLTNSVIINQKGNILRGDSAETNLNTGISKITANKNSKNRVSGVFKETKKESPKNDK